MEISMTFVRWQNIDRLGSRKHYNFWAVLTPFIIWRRTGTVGNLKVASFTLNCRVEKCNLMSRLFRLRPLRPQLQRWVFQGDGIGRRMGVIGLVDATNLTDSGTEATVKTDIRTSTKPII